MRPVFARDAPSQSALGLERTGGHRSSYSANESVNSVPSREHAGRLAKASFQDGPPRECEKSTPPCPGASVVSNREGDKEQASPRSHEGTEGAAEAARLRARRAKPVRVGS